MVLHANQAREMSSDARAACARFIDAGIPMLCQSVLLRGVNDDAETLGALMRALVECRIKPYYLHHGDLAPGTGHWRTTIDEGRALMRALHGRYSGLCQPSYVLDIPGGHGKSPIGPCYLTPTGDQRQRPLRDRGLSRAAPCLSAGGSANAVTFDPNASVRLRLVDQLLLKLIDVRLPIRRELSLRLEPSHDLPRALHLRRGVVIEIIGER